MNSPQNFPTSKLWRKRRSIFNQSGTSFNSTIFFSPVYYWFRIFSPIISNLFLFLLVVQKFQYFHGRRSGSVAAEFSQISNTAHQIPARVKIFLNPSIPAPRFMILQTCTKNRQSRRSRPAKAKEAKAKKKRRAQPRHLPPHPPPAAPKIYRTSSSPNCWTEKIFHFTKVRKIYPFGSIFR